MYCYRLDGELSADLAAYWLTYGQSDGQPGFKLINNIPGVGENDIAGEEDKRVHFILGTVKAICQDNGWTDPPVCIYKLLSYDGGRGEDSGDGRAGRDGGDSGLAPLDIAGFLAKDVTSGGGRTEQCHAMLKIAACEYPNRSQLELGQDEDGQPLICKTHHCVGNGHRAPAKMMTFGSYRHFLATRYANPVESGLVAADPLSHTPCTMYVQGVRIKPAGLAALKKACIHVPPEMLDEELDEEKGQLIDRLPHVSICTDSNGQDVSVEIDVFKSSPEMFALFGRV